jgi:hypothetical protein
MEGSALWVMGNTNTAVITSDFVNWKNVNMFPGYSNLADVSLIEIDDHTIYAFADAYANDQRYVVCILNSFQFVTNTQLFRMYSLCFHPPQYGIPWDRSNVL